jgi:L-fucose mutarotase
MIRGPLTHPHLLAALAESGHGTRVLIADGNYPFRTGAHHGARHVYLNLRRGLVSVTDVLESIAATVPLEAAEAMRPDDGSEPAVFAEFRRLLPDIDLRVHDRHAFYDLACRPDVGVVVATGEARLYANLLVTIGVVPAEG